MLMDTKQELKNTRPPANTPPVNPIINKTPDQKAEQVDFVKTKFQNMATTIAAK